MKDHSSYITYIVPLIQCIEETDEPILELGMGYSTMILHALCKKNKRQIISYENDPKWYKENLCYRNDYHEINLVTDWSKVPLEKIFWGVVLVDHRPAVRRRVEALRVRNNAEFVLLHDAEPEIERFYGYSKVYNEFKYKHIYDECKPYTAVLSNFVDIQQLMCA